MPGRSQTHTVKDGRIRFVCGRCERKRFLIVPTGVRRKQVRCVCGLSVQLTLNHRASNRESTSSKAHLLLEGGREYPVYVCDTSLGGIGFIIPPQFNRSIHLGKEMRIKFRNLVGATVLRKIQIRNKGNFRIGAQFLDGLPPSF